MSSEPLSILLLEERSVTFTHDSRTADNEPDWASVEKNRLPLAAYANRQTAEPHDRSSWKYAHHWVKDAGPADGDGTYRSGTLLLHRAGLKTAWAAAMRARAAGNADPEAIEHLRTHRRELGLDGRENAVELDASEPGDVPEWVQIAQTGSWLGHPDGPEVITERHLRSARDYYTRHYAANDADLPIDYHHASVYAGKDMSRAPAAGWIKEMELRADGAELWARASWTDEARSAIAARKFRYLSPVFRWNQPDRVTGRVVPLQIPSVALTNTPFLTELQSLNESAGTDAGDPRSPQKKEGQDISLLQKIAQVLDRKPEKVAAALGLDGSQPEDAAVARAIMKMADGEGTEESVPREVTNALGLAPDAGEQAVRARIIALTAPEAGQGAIRQALGLDATADQADVLNAIGELKRDGQRRDAEALVNRAVREGKILPAQREFYLNSARQDPEATRMCLENMPPVVSSGINTSGPDAPAGNLTEAERAICRQLDIDEERFLEHR